MSALRKLQEKIEQWRIQHEAIKSENAQFKIQLSTVVQAHKEELERKDAEIEKIIAQVDALLDDK
jgi:hypothetical protein